MLSLTHSLRSLAIAGEAIPSNYKYQAVRWRKPRWVPKAKSKIFKVPERPVIPEEEKLELMRLYNNYRTKVKSLRSYLVAKHCTKFQASEDPEEQRRLFEEDLQHCIKMNNEWNEKQRIFREQAMTEELEANLSYARKRLEDELIKQEEKIKAIEEIVQKQKEAAKNFILPENIDEAIDKALENPVDYNFAITLNGEKIIGYYNHKVGDKNENVVKQ
ncbi:unnamed protein product [Acanthoscelides obtectus]|uniref:Small ribosomal subunit protein mS26 n=1 Tax=Acanthoscelides obtectus TaxID=200917 RepID=A0A9P0P681_ACAOB|nr:unnamed protein product [Acanthoscelides obtectus]CAK1667374.1 Probable 28S ribosomal protein S26, mitochondrial [Acanthoscelides obtectus]